jgi:quercetin dioxygenase-like cupin family protein
MTRRHTIAAALAAIALPALAIAASPLRSTVTPVFQHAIPNIPGKSLVSVVVNFAPGAKSASHRHAPSAFIYAYVLSGAVRSQVDDEPVKVYQAGETWFEPPGAHHVISENASDSEPAKVLTVFVVDANDSPLTIPDHE